MTEPDPLEWTPDCDQVLLERPRISFMGPIHSSIHMHTHTHTQTSGRTHQESHTHTRKNSPGERDTHTHTHTHTHGRTYQESLPKVGASDSVCSLF